MKRLLTTLLFLLAGQLASAQGHWFRYYSDNRAVIVRDSLYGFVDRSGAEVIPCRYKKAYCFNDGIAMVRLGHEVFAIDTLGNRLDRKVTIPQFRGKEFENYVRWVWRRIPFASSDEYRRMRIETVNAVITIGTDGTVTACEPAEAGHEEAFAKVRAVVLESPKWTPGTVDGQPCEIRYLLPVEFRKVYPPRCYPIDEGGFQIEREFVYPLFQGKYAYGFYDWFYKHLKYKNSDEYYRAARGVVQAAFTVDRKGVVRDVEIIKSHNDVCRGKVLELLGKSPKWTPGSIDGEAVAVRYDLSFYFNFR